MRISGLIGPLLGALTLTTIDARDGGDDPMKQLQGTWTLVSGEKAGQKSPERDAQSVSVIITQDTLTFRRPRHEETTRMALDPTTRPRQITLTQDDGSIRPGIYEIGGDTLRICLSGTDERPRDFTSPPGSRIALMVLERQKR